MALRATRTLPLPFRLARKRTQCARGYGTLARKPARCPGTTHPPAHLRNHGKHGNPLCSLCPLWLKISTFYMFYTAKLPRASQILLILLILSVKLRGLCAKTLCALCVKLTERKDSSPWSSDCSAPYDKGTDNLKITCKINTQSHIARGRFSMCARKTTVRK